MLDPKLLRSQLDVVANRLQCRHVELDTAKLQSFEESRRTLQSETEQLQAERNRTMRFCCVLTLKRLVSLSMV